MLIDILNETEIAVDIHTSPPQYRVTLESNCPARGGISQLSFHYHQKRKEMMCACCVHPKGVKKYFVFFILFSLVYWQEAGDSPAMNNSLDVAGHHESCHIDQTKKGNLSLIRGRGKKGDKEKQRRTEIQIRRQSSLLLVLLVFPECNHILLLKFHELLGYF